MKILAHPIVGAATTITGLTASALAVFHVINVILGVFGGFLAVLAGYYHFRLNYAKWKQFRNKKPWDE